MSLIEDEMARLLKGNEQPVYAFLYAYFGNTSTLADVIQTLTVQEVRDVWHAARTLVDKCGVAVAAAEREEYRRRFPQLPGVA